MEFAKVGVVVCSDFPLWEEITNEVCYHAAFFCERPGQPQWSPFQPNMLEGLPSLLSGLCSPWSAPHTGPQRTTSYCDQPPVAILISLGHSSSMFDVIFIGAWSGRIQLEGMRCPGPAESHVCPGSSAAWAEAGYPEPFLCAPLPCKTRIPGYSLVGPSWELFSLHGQLGLPTHPEPQGHSLPPGSVPGNLSSWSNDWSL